MLTVIIRRRASIIPSIMYKLLVSPPAHSGPRMVARPPTERLTPWLKPAGENITRNQRAPFGCAFLSHARRATLGLFRRDFGEEGHLRHGHKREPQQLEEDPDDEGRQLPPVPTWGKDGGQSPSTTLALQLLFRCLGGICASSLPSGFGAPPTSGLAPADARLYLQPGAAAKLAAAAFFVLRGVFVSRRTRPDCWTSPRRSVIS